MGQHFDYTIDEKAAEVFLDLVDRALAQDTEDISDAVYTAIDDGLIYDDDRWSIISFYEPSELSDETYEQLFNDTVAIVDIVKNGNLDDNLTESDTKLNSDNINWEELLEAADSHLDDLIAESGNSDYDDGDGYWQSENSWCFRKLYQGSIPNPSQLESLCNKYSKYLPNVEFYFVDDEDISEIGYVATN